MISSLHRKGDCWDNARVERFSGSLKSERIVFCPIATRKSAHIDILGYIIDYSFTRLQSTPEDKNPMRYEKDQSLNVS
jgi:transposase InsO family protein